MPPIKRRFRDASADQKDAAHVARTAQTTAPAYRLAFSDPDFLTRDALRPVRLQLELLKPEMIFDEEGVDSTVVLFGGARIRPERPEHEMTEGQAALTCYYHEAEKFAALVTAHSMAQGGRDHVIVTGGGPGVMEAGNKGAANAGGRSIGLGIVLPHESAPNAYVTPELSLNFHYFSIRKMHFLLRAAAICVFPGGFGTLDELFEALTLIQTKRMEAVPILLFGTKFWNELINFKSLVNAGTIAAKDLELFNYVDTAEEAFEILFESGDEMAQIDGA